MIRIPFSSDSESHEAGSKASSRKVVMKTDSSSSTLEERIGKLEVKLDVHAQDLKDRVTERVERIESRIERAMTSLSGKSETEAADNVIEFAAEAKAMHHLPTASAISALNELNATLKQTREHLEALQNSVDQMRSAVPSQKTKSA